MAAAVIAFGTGWLLSSLLPSSAVEQDAAQKVEAAVGGPLKDSVQEVAGNLQQPLQETAQSLTQTATDAATKTADQAKAAASGVKDTARNQTS